MAEIEIGRAKRARRAYSFDDVAIVPGRRTRDPEDVQLGWRLGDMQFDLPLLASAMDGVVSPTTAIALGRLGGLAVLNLEGLFSRYEDAEQRCAEIAGLPAHTVLKKPMSSGWESGAWVLDFVGSWEWTIPGGSSEIQRSIIGERGLGLPREPVSS